MALSLAMTARSSDAVLQALTFRMRSRNLSDMVMCCYVLCCGVVWCDVMQGIGSDGSSWVSVWMIHKIGRSSPLAG